MHRKRREIIAKLKDTLRKSILRKNTGTEMYQREKADSKSKVDSLKRRKKHEIEGDEIQIE